MRAINAKRFSKVMRDMAKVQSRASAEISRELSNEIQKRMDASQDPYGKAWPLRSNGKRTKLKDSGRGRASIAVRPTSGAGLRITVAVLYMIYHQFGGKSHLRGHRKNPDFGRDADRSRGRNKPPTRSFIPFDRMPPRWEKIIQRAVTNAAKRVLGG